MNQYKQREDPPPPSPEQPTSAFHPRCKATRSAWMRSCARSRSRRSATTSPSSRSIQTRPNRLTARNFARGSTPCAKRPAAASSRCLYVHKVDRLARRLEWSLEIVHELQALDIIFKAVQQPFDLSTPEGKLLFHLVSSLGEFYSDNLSKETNKGKLESSLQGYHNGAVPWGYNSELSGKRKVGVPDPEKAPIVIEMFERYATGKYSDMQITEWLNTKGLYTNRGHPFGKDTVRDMLCNAYYAGKIRYRGMSVRPKGVSFRSTPPKVSTGQHEAIISEELWQRCQAVRTSRHVEIETVQKTVRINLLQGLAVCARCGRRLRIQTPKRGPTYYREDSHLRGYTDCSDISQSVRAESVDAQVGELVQSIKLPANWEDSVRRLCQEQREGPDPEVERKDIRTKIRVDARQLRTRPVRRRGIPILAESWLFEREAGPVEQGSRASHRKSRQNTARSARELGVGHQRRAQGTGPYDDPASGHRCCR